MRLEGGVPLTVGEKLQEGFSLSPLRKGRWGGGTAACGSGRTLWQGLQWGSSSMGPSGGQETGRWGKLLVYLRATL